MRKINTRHFHVATRRTARQVNRQIVLNLIREHQPISRAELARRMGVGRGQLTQLVRELIASGVVYEEGFAAPTSGPGRPPTLLHLCTTSRLVLAVDVRPGRTQLALAGFDGRVVATASVATPGDPAVLVATLVDGSAALQQQARDLLGAAGVACEGVGLVVPGMVDRRTGRVLYAPRLGWRNVALGEMLAAHLGLPVHVESAAIAGAIARLWLSPEETRGVHSFAYVSIADGVGVGLVVDGEPLHGHAHTAGEFGHVSLHSLHSDGPACACGKRGCWEAYVCNSATVARYLARVSDEAGARRGGRHHAPHGAAITVDEVVRRAVDGEPAAVAALTQTGEYIGRGLAVVVNAFNPGRVYVAGELTTAWALLEGPIRLALAEGTLTDAAHATPVVPDPTAAKYRLFGAVALVAAPTFAAPSIG